MALTNLWEPQGSHTWVRRATASSLHRLLTLAGLGVAAWLCGGAAAAIAAESPEDPAPLSVVESAELGDSVGTGSASEPPAESVESFESGDVESADKEGGEASQSAVEGATAGESESAGGSRAGDVVRVVGDEARSLVSHSTLDRSVTVGSAQDTVATLSTHVREQAEESLTDTGEVLDRAAHRTSRGSAGDSPGSLTELEADVRDVITEISGLRDMPHVQVGSENSYEDHAERATFVEAGSLADGAAESGNEPANASSSNRELTPDRSFRERVAPAAEVPATERQQEALGTPDAGPEVPGHDSSDFGPADFDPASAVSALESTVSGSTSAQAPVSAVAADLGARDASLPIAVAHMAAPDGPRFIIPGASSNPFFSPD